ncbi:MAG TPA: nicotinate phosphoribosyltransferase [Spirochaetia bacterium]|nr:nicotinate phosphoribosyltransferase [Spirochaetia bacterium]
MRLSPLLTDLYELTMMQGYFLNDRNPRVVFDMFFRRQPFHGGFSLFAGLDDLLDGITGLSFSQDELEYLDSLKLFRREFLELLADFRFQGDIYSVEEGTPVFPNEPLIRVHGGLLETQLVESVLLTIINFQSLIATKASRILLASHGGNIVEFGLRRAQGVDGALSAARAAYIGGASATSNTLAGKLYGLPVRGTMAHSWVMAFDNELESFERYAELYPDMSVLLIDTYDTLGSGLANAIRVGRILKAKGKRLGVRLDSGDLEYLSKRVRRELDEAGLNDATIFVSNELDEEIIHELVTAGSPIDGWGVGTQLVTGGSEAAFSGVYKLVAKEENGEMIPTIKISNNPEKSTTPGIKQLYRYYDAQGTPLGDLLALEEENHPKDGPVVFHHPLYEERSFTLRDYAERRPLLTQVVRAGRRISPREQLPAVRERAIELVHHLDETYKRLLNPHIYKVSLSHRLKELKLSMLHSDHR